MLSYVAALGAPDLLFEHVLGFAGVDWSIPLMGFVFGRLGHHRGVLEGLTSTGGVITSAGIVLAATFAIFAGLPLMTMAQMGVLVGIGVLLDTFLVRTIPVPALALDLRRWFWWPGSLFHTPPTARNTPRNALSPTAQDPTSKVERTAAVHHRGRLARHRAAHHARTAAGEPA